MTYAFDPEIARIDPDAEVIGVSIMFSLEWPFTRDLVNQIRTRFPHAFIGVMEQLQHAVKTGTPPALSVADNVKTMALVEAGYRSIASGRTVKLSEIPTN